MHYFVLSGGWRVFFLRPPASRLSERVHSQSHFCVFCMYVCRMEYVRMLLHYNIFSRFLGSFSFSVNYFGDQRVGYQLRKQIMVLVDQSSNLDLLCMKRRRTDEVEGEEVCWFLGQAVGGCSDRFVVAVGER